MKRMIRAELRLQFTGLWQMGLVMLFLFALGEGMMIALMAWAEADEPATLACIFALMGYAFWFFAVGVQLVFGSNWAISMGRTRKSYLAAHYLVNILYSLVMGLGCWLLIQLEKLLLGWRYSGLPMEFDLSETFTLPVMALIAVAGVVVASFLGALISRFGKKAFWPLWAVWMFTFLVLPRMTDGMESGKPDTLLGMMGVGVFGAVAAVPLSVWQTLGCVALVGCLVGTVALMMKKTVTLE